MSPKLYTQSHFYWNAMAVLAPKCQDAQEGHLHWSEKKKVYRKK